MFGYEAGIFLVFLAVLFLVLGYVKVTRRKAGWRGGLAWGLACLGSLLGAYPHFIPTPPQAMFRIDLILVDYALLPVLTLAALGGVTNELLWRYYERNS